MKIRGMEVTVAEDGDLIVDGLGTVANPFKGITPQVDIGQLWLQIWAEDLHNKPNAQRIRSILLNSVNLAVAQVLQALQQSGG